MGRRAEFINDRNWEIEQREELRSRGLWPDAKDINAHGFDIIDGENKIELKIVRWKGREYTAVTLETLSNVEMNRVGWMEYSDADTLEYWFARPDGWLGNSWHMQDLKKWFWQNNRFASFYEHLEPNKAPNGETYHTASRVVPLIAIPETIYIFRNRMVER